MYSPEALAEKAYSAYSGSMGNVDGNGTRLHTWQSLHDREKAGWLAAVHQVTTAVNEVGSRKLAHADDDEDEHKKAKAHSHSVK
jgi:hypothetical protein